jgi:hypothetical protein
MNGNLAAVSGADDTISQQYLSTFRRSEQFEPEFALLRAILEDAVHCYRKYQSAQSGAGRESFLEVEAWIMDSQSDWIFSFENVCELLALDPTYVRQKLGCPQRKTLSHQGARQHARRHVA